MKCIFFCCSRKGFRLFVQAAKHLAVWLSKPCVSLKYCGLCPHPQPLKRLTKLFKLFNHNSLISYSLIIILIIYLIIKLKCIILCNNKNILLLLFQDSIIKKNGVFTDKNSKKEKEELKWIKTMAQSMMPANLANQR